MTHLNPPVLLTWTIFSGLLGAFLVSHLYAFDRFKCLRWNQGSQGAFKRVMTYSYITSIPLLFIYSLGFTVIKYQEGLVDIPIYGIVPKPYELWTAAHRQAILPLNICFAVCWALELVSHLEELCFWMYVVNSGPMQSEWFNSLHFKVWTVGSVVSLIYMPLAAIFTRADPIRNEAVIFLSGAVGSGLITITFFPVLWKFPAFLRGLRREGVDTNTVVRLTKFHELNSIRVVFRVLFFVPLFILACDGLTPHKHVNENKFASDFLAIIASIGLLVSSGITLTIFFPRNIEHEIDRETRHNRGIFSTRSGGGPKNLTFISQEQEMYGTYVAPDAKAAHGHPHARTPSDDLYADDDTEAARSPVLPAYGLHHQPSYVHAQVYVQPRSGLGSQPTSPAPVARLEPNRRPADTDDALRPGTGSTRPGTGQSAAGAGGYTNLKSHSSSYDPARAFGARGVGAPLRGRMTHFAQSFRSPIDFRRPEM